MDRYLESLKDIMIHIYAMDRDMYVDRSLDRYISI